MALTFGKVQVNIDYFENAFNGNPQQRAERIKNYLTKQTGLKNFSIKPVPGHDITHIEHPYGGPEVDTLIIRALSRKGIEANPIV